MVLKEKKSEIGRVKLQIEFQRKSGSSPTEHTIEIPAHGQTTSSPGEPPGEREPVDERRIRKKNETSKGWGEVKRWGEVVHTSCL